MIKQYFTFGFGQPLHGFCVAINGNDASECRAYMFELFGNKWSMQYSNLGDFKPEKWSLKLLRTYNTDGTYYDQ